MTHRNRSAIRIQQSGRLGAALLFLSWIAPGCGPDGPARYPVSGSVTFAGLPRPDGDISFIPDPPGPRAYTATTSEGRYALEATAGAKRVQIQASRFVGPENKIMGLRAKQQYVPERYNVETTLMVTVSPDSDNQFDFPLTSDEVSP